MEFSVHFVADAEEDLFQIYRYVAEETSAEAAKRLMDGIEKACLSLADLPERGHLPPELERIGISAYREIHFKPYRILYQVLNRDVFIHAVLDGRRDLHEILHRKLLR